MSSDVVRCPGPASVDWTQAGQQARPDGGPGAGLGGTRTSGEALYGPGSGSVEGSLSPFSPLSLPSLSLSVSLSPSLYLSIYLSIDRSIDRSLSLSLAGKRLGPPGRVCRVGQVGSGSGPAQ